MRFIPFILVLLATSFCALAQDNVGIGTSTPHSNSVLDITSTDKGLLIPRMSTAERLAIGPIASAAGLLVYDTTDSNFWYWDGTQWVQVGSGIGTVGPTGPTGSAGADGADGADGATGPAGTDGADGATGPSGADGATGPAGADGIDGADGATGPAGADGTNGTDGATGPAGADGTDGADGATGPAGADGTDGADGATGPAGADGADGSIGPVGAQGPTGNDGADGVTGANGATGPAGADGADGATGPAGTDGANGADGPTGPAGAQGPTGFLDNGAAAGNTPYWNGSEWILNSSNIYNNGGNIGIGTNSPAAPLEVNGEIYGHYRMFSIHSFDNSTFQNGTGILYFPANGDGADDGPVGGLNSVGNDYRRAWSAPFNGRLIKVIVRNGNDSNGGLDLQARITMDVDGTLMTTPSAFAMDGNSSSSMTMPTNFTFNEGQRIGVGFNFIDDAACPGNDCYVEDSQYFVTLVWEYEVFE